MDIKITIPILYFIDWNLSNLEVNPDALMIETFQNQLNTLILMNDPQELEMIRPHPMEWEEISFPNKYKLLKLNSYIGKGMPNHHLYYLKAFLTRFYNDDMEISISACFIKKNKGEPALDFIKKFHK